MIMTTLKEIPTAQLNQIVNRFPAKFRDDLRNDLVLLFLELPEAKRTPLYIGVVFPKRCLGFLSEYAIDHDVEVFLDDIHGTNEYEREEYIFHIEDPECLQRKIIRDDLITKLRLNPIERQIQEWYYMDGYSVKEIIELYVHKTHIKNPNTIYKILKKGA